MRLAELLQGIEFTELVEADENLDLLAVTNDSRRVKPGTVFVAMAGTQTDGHRFVDDALTRGAACIVHEKAVEVPPGTCRMRVPDARRLYPLLAARLCGEPSGQLRAIGVTGTNGKTTVTLLIDSILRAAGYRPAVLGTLGVRLPLTGKEADPLQFSGRGLTTPDAAEVQLRLQECQQLGATHVVMEASSHAIDQGRIDFVHFRGRLFTNLSQDHLDYHITMEEYARAKRSFFHRPEFGPGEYAVTNLDDELGREIADLVPYPCLNYGLRARAAFAGRVLKQDLRGTTAEMRLDPATAERLGTRACEPGITVRSPLVGAFNVYNMLAAAGAACMEQVSAEHIAAGIQAVTRVPGRLERVENDCGFEVFVDYAHTPDALINVLAALRESGGARVICVFGCGGDRDRAKRPLMGRAACAGADLVVITNDNPRSEDPMEIIRDILSGIPPEAKGKCLVEPDRRQAISRALGEARPGEVVLLAGKGHEDYQIFADRTEQFSDAAVARELLARLA